MAFSYNATHLVIAQNGAMIYHASLEDAQAAAETAASDLYDGANGDRAFIVPVTEVRRTS